MTRAAVLVVTFESAAEKLISSPLVGYTGLFSLHFQHPFGRYIVFSAVWNSTVDYSVPYRGMKYKKYCVPEYNKRICV